MGAPSIANARLSILSSEVFYAFCVLKNLYNVLDLEFPMF